MAASFNIIRKPAPDGSIVTNPNKFSQPQSPYVSQACAEDLRSAIVDPHPPSEQAELELRLERAESALRSSERRLQLVLETTHLAAWEWDVVTGEVCWSCNLEPLLGWSADLLPVTYEAWMQQVHPDDRLRFTLTTAFIVVTNGEGTNDYRMLQPDGSFRWLQNEGRVFCDCHNQPLRVSGVTRSLTDSDRHEPPPKPFYSQSEFERLRTQLIETVSHKIRTPLTIVQTAAELLEHYEWSAVKKQERFQQIYQAIQQVTEFLDEEIRQTEVEIS